MVLLLAAMLAPGAAQTGVFGIPCEAGTASPSGFEPCTACPAGTFAQFTGSIACEPVPEGTWAPQGSPGFNFCSCSDEPLCTIDRCDAATGACTTHDPAPACTPYAVRAEGTVTDVVLGQPPSSPGLPGVFSIGMPIVATWIVDPSVIDSRIEESEGVYRKAIRDLRVRAGTGPATVEATADDSELQIYSSIQSLVFYIFSGMAAGFEGADFGLWLEDGNPAVIPSDAIPPAFPPATSFGSPVLRFAVYQGASVATAISDDFTLTTPEPGASLVGVVALLGIALLARRRARRGIAALIVLAALAPGAAQGGVFGIPCEAGTASASGFEPCTACPAGTFAPFSGAVACDAVPAGTWAPAGASGVESCECADLPLCTLDPCDAATGACLAHEPAPACLPYQVTGSGTVDSAFFQQGSAEVFTVGMPFVARFLVDPAEFDRFYSDTLGFYPNAIRDVHLRIGDGGESFDWVAEFGALDILLGTGGGDFMTLVVEGEAAGLAAATFRIVLLGDDLVLGTDAIPPAFPAAIPGSGSIMSFSVGEGLFGATTSDFVLTTPESGTATAAVASGAALLGLYRQRRRSAVGGF